MTKLLEEGIEAARALPAERQDFVGELLMTLAAQPELTTEQLEEVKLAQVEAAQGVFATDEQIVAFWDKAGV